MPRKLSDIPLTPAQKYHREHLDEIRARKKAVYAMLSDEEREAKNAEKRARHAANKERINAERAAKRLANLEEERAKAAAWKIANPDKVRGQQHRADARRKDNPERITQKKARYHRLDRKEDRRKRAEWRAANPEIVKAAHKRRKALKRGAAVSDFTAAQWREMQAAYDHRCVYCGKRAKGHLTQDHLTPLSKDGAHTKHNILPACQSCNSRKHAGEVLTPVQPLLLTVAPSKPRKA